ncbi:MAG: radical SAM protein [Proteobacteria bacterium]|nr:radical SAM protein [Pseudomonadota bacterium]
MTRQIQIVGIGIHTKTSPCAHACRYCLMGRKSSDGVSTARHIAVVDRFIEWRARNKTSDFQIGQAVNYASNLSAEDQGQLMQLHKRLGWARLTMRIHLGGLPIWSDAEIAKWLRVRKASGVETVHGSLAGHGRIHDYWNNRKGDFDYLLKIFRFAADEGLGLRQRLFAIKSTLSILGETVALLDQAGEPVERYLMPFFYRGTALRHEQERISKRDLDALAPTAQYLLDRDDHRWRSEADWVSVLRNSSHDAEPISLQLELTARNIETIEKSSCDEILERLTKQTLTAYDAIPGREELLERWSDDQNTYIYPYAQDVERLWLDRYLRENPTKFERHLTHLTDRH